MRHILKSMLVMLLVVVISGVVNAQDKIPIEMGQWVSGEVTIDQYETKYIFGGKAGQLVMAVMMADVEEGGLDGFMVLRTSDGDIVAQNDDVPDGFALVVATLPADGEYTLLATRPDGKNGDSTGKYWVRLDEAQPLTAGTKISVSITSPDEKSFPTFYVVAPESAGSMKFGFNLSSGSRYPQISLFKWLDDNYPDILMLAEYMSGISNMAFSADLQGNTFYVLMVDPIPIFYGGDDNATLTFSVN